LPELEQVFDQVLAFQAERKAVHLAALEASLPIRINSEVSERRKQWTS